MLVSAVRRRRTLFVVVFAVTVVSLLALTAPVAGVGSAVPGDANLHTDVNPDAEANLHTGVNPDAGASTHADRATLAPAGGGETVGFLADDDDHQSIDHDRSRLGVHPTVQTPLRTTDDTQSGSFGQSEYTTAAGDLVTIDVAVDGAGPTYVVVGGDQLSDGRTTGFLDILRVDGDRTITINTRLLGTNATTDEVYAASGDVYSYAHGPGDGAERDIHTTEFSDLSFESDDGDQYDTLAELRSAAGVGYNPAPLAPQRYRLLLGYGDTLTVQDGTVHLEHRLARADLRLESPEFREQIDVYTALTDDVDEAGSLDDLLGSARERHAITHGDALILGFEATGLWGALAAQSATPLDSTGNLSVDSLHDLTTSETGSITGEGVSLRVRQTNPGRNEAATELTLDGTSDGHSLLYGPPTDLTGYDDGPNPGALYLVVDTSEVDAFSASLDDGDEFSVTFGLAGIEGDRYRFDRSGGEAASPFAAESVNEAGVAEQFPYRTVAEGPVSATANFSVREPMMAYHNVTDDGIILVENGSIGTITGNTTLHPETDLTAELVVDAGPSSRVNDRPVEIADDDSFRIRTVLSDIPPGSSIALDVYDGTSLYDSRSIVVVEDLEHPSSLAIDDAPANVTVSHGEPLSNLSVDIRNDGYVAGLERLTLSVDNGSLTDDRRIRVRPDRVETVVFSRATADLDPGEYTYSVSIENSESTGTLTVTPDSAVDSDSAATTYTDSQTTTDASTDAGSSTDTATDAPAVSDDSSGGDDSLSSDEDDRSGETAGDDSADGGDPADSEDSEDSEDPADDEATPTMIPFGIGPRETLGGTALVGVTYLLGHWI